MSTVYFVGAGPGSADLITLRGKALLENADVIIYTGSLVNPDLPAFAKQDCEVFNSAHMTLDEVIDTIQIAVTGGKTVVRLHTGDPSLYGAIREQMDRLTALNIEYEICPGVSSFNAAAAALKAEYTLPGVSQTVILTRAAGKTPVPESETIRSLAAHKATMVLFLSAGLLETVSGDLIAGDMRPILPLLLFIRQAGRKKKLCGARLGRLPKVPLKTMSLRQRLSAWAISWGMLMNYPDCMPPIFPQNIGRQSHEDFYNCFLSVRGGTGGTVHCIIG